MALSTKPWGDVSEGDYKDANAFCAACLVDMNAPGAEKSKAQCKLPVREPGGMLNRNAMLAAQGALAGARGGVDLPPAERKKAARKLASMMKANGMMPADSMKQMAGM